MMQHQYVDEFIAETCDGMGCEFTPSDYRIWMQEHHPDQAHKWSDQLSAHRQRPKTRVFTTECLTRRKRKDENGREVEYETVGMGPRSFYRVVETGRGVKRTAVLAMHLREVDEMFSRWENEMRFRVQPLAERDKRAMAAFGMVKAEIRSAVLLLHARLRYFDDDEDQDGE